MSMEDIFSKKNKNDDGSKFDDETSSNISNVGTLGSSGRSSIEFIDSEEEELLLKDFSDDSHESIYSDMKSEAGAGDENETESSVLDSSSTDTDSGGDLSLSQQTSTSSDSSSQENEMALQAVDCAERKRKLEEEEAAMAPFKKSVAGLPMMGKFIKCEKCEEEIKKFSLIQRCAKCWRAYHHECRTIANGVKDWTCELCSDSEKPDSNGHDELKLPKCQVILRKLNIDPKQVSSWTVNDVECYIISKGFEAQASKFRYHEIDGEGLLLMNRHHVVNLMGIEESTAIELYMVVRKLQLDFELNTGV